MDTKFTSIARKIKNLIAVFFIECFLKIKIRTKVYNNILK